MPVPPRVRAEVRVCAFSFSLIKRFPEFAYARACALALLATLFMGALPILAQVPTLTITANNLAKFYGDPNPTLTYTVTGFVNGDTSSVLSGAPALSTTATQASVVGVLPITISQGTLTAPSYYALQFVNGTLTIEPKDMVAAGTTPEYLYSGDWLGNTVTAYAIDSSTGALTQLTTVSSGLTPTAISADPLGRFVFSNNTGSNNVLSYVIQPNGVLSSYSAVLGGAGNSIGVDPTGKFLYDAGASTMQGFTFNAVGVLTAVGSQTPVGPNAKYGIAFEPAGKYVYETNSSSGAGTGNIRGFKINGDGALTELPGSPYQAPAPTNPLSLAVDPLGRFLYVGEGYGGTTVDGYRIDPNTGALTPLPGSPFPATEGRGIAMDRTGRFLYVSNENSGTTSAFAIDQTSGVLAFINTYSGGGGQPAVDPTNNFLYVGNQGGSLNQSNISAFRINQSDGSLGAIGEFPAGVGPWALTTATGPQATLTTVTATAPTVAYGQAATINATIYAASGSVVPTGTVTFTDSNSSLSSGPISVINGNVSWTTSALTAGTHAITATYASGFASLTSSSATTTQIVAPAVLTVTANPASMFTGGSLPAFTATYSGFVNGDSIKTALSGAPGFTTTATSSSLPGSYPVTVSQGTLSSPNYTFAFVNGTLLVYPAFEQVAGAVISTGLTHWWRAENSAIDTQGSDALGAIMGTLNNSAGYAAGEVGQGFSFNSANQASVTFGNSVGNFGTTDFTIDFWMKTSATTEQAILDKRDVCNPTSFFSLRMASGGSLFVEMEQDANGANQLYEFSSATINDGKFHHVALVRQGAVVHVYVDGVDQGAWPTSGGTTNISNTAPFELGRSACSGVDGTGWFNGTIDELHIFDRALSSGEVQSIYNAGTNGLSTLVGWWKLDEGTGTMTADSSGYGNTGTLTGTTLPAWTTDVPVTPFFDPAALSFDGHTSYLSVAGGATSSALNFTTQVTISAWVKPSYLTNTPAAIVSKNQNPTTGGWGLRMENQSPNFFLNNVVNGSGVNCSVHALANPFVANTWTNVTATYDSSTSTVQLFVNGVNVPVDGQSCSGRLIASAQPLQVGQEIPGWNFPGEIDDVRVYNRVLSPAEIANLVATPTVALASSQNPAAYGQTVNLSAAVQVNGSPATSGTLTFNDGGTVLAGPYQLGATGTVSFGTSQLAVGDHSIAAVYEGAGGYSTATLTQTVVTPIVTAGPIGLPASSQSTFTGGNSTSLADTYVTPYTATQDGWITSWQTEFTGGLIGTSPAIPAGVQIKVFRLVAGQIQVVAAGPVHDPRPLLQAHFPQTYPNFSNADSLTTFTESPIPVAAGDFIGLTVYADPTVGQYLYPMVGPAGTLQVSGNIPIGQGINPTDTNTHQLPQPPALSFTVAPKATANPLNLLNNWFVTGDYVARGVTLWGTGINGVATGSISIPNATQDPADGVPDGADIVGAYLYWESVENTPTPSAASGTFRGYAITGQQVGKDLNFNDHPGHGGVLRVYRADVLGYLPIVNGVRLAATTHTITLPDGGSGNFPATQGASLVVIWRVMSPNVPLKSVVIYDGSSVSDANAVPAFQTIRGFYDAADLGQSVAKVTNLYSDYGTWTNDFHNVAPSTGAEYDAVLNSGPNQAWGAVIFSTPVNDSDHDGILDAWKAGPPPGDFHAGQPGYYDVKYGQWIPLPGAKRGEKDLFVQLDYMCSIVLPDGTCDTVNGHSHLPVPNAQGQDPMAMLTQAFANHGIALHLMIGNAIQEETCTDNTSTIPPQLCEFPNEPGVVNWKIGLDISKIWPRNPLACAEGIDCSPRFPYGAKDSYHYVLMGHSLGIAAWNSRWGTVTGISVAGGTTTITTADRGSGIEACPNRITISGVIGNPALNGTYNVASCNGTTTQMMISTPGVPDWTYPNSTLDEPLLGISSGVVTSISGFSDLGGADSVVSLGKWETDPNQDMSKKVNVQTGTIMHEIGHTLGLSHGGTYYDTPGSYSPSFEANCKPNYQSIMNYMFQIDLLGPDHVLDYSNQQLDTIDEDTLSSLTGLGQTVGTTFTLPAISTSRWYVPWMSGDTASPATRHCDGTPIGGSGQMYRIDGDTQSLGWTSGQDINYDGQVNSQMRGFDDWSHIDLRQLGATGGEFVSLANLLSFGNVASPLNIGAGGNITLGSGGTVTLGSGGTVALGSGGTVTMGSGGTVTLGSGGTVTLGSGGTVTLGSGGTIALGSGGTVALGSGGTVTLGSGGTITLGSGGNIVLGSGGTVTLGSGGTVTDGGNTYSVAPGGMYTFSGSGGTIALGSGGNVTLGSGGLVTLGSGGTIALGSGGTVALGSGGTVTLGSGGTITMGSGGTVALGSGGTITLGSGGTITLGSGGTVTLGSGGNVTLGSGGTVTLGSGGTIALGSGGNIALGSGGTVTLGSGGTVTLGSGGTVTLGSGGLVTLGSGGTITLGSGGTITLGSGGTVTLGSGGTVTDGTSTYTVSAGGTVTLGSGGTITLGSGGNVTLGSGGTVTMGSGGTIALGSGGTVTLGSGGTVTLGSGGNVTLGSGGVVTLGSGGTIALGSGGNVTLGSGGTVALGSGGTIALGSGGNVTLGSGGTVTLGSGGSTLGEMTYEAANSIVRPPDSPAKTPIGSALLISWTPPAFGLVSQYIVYRSVNGGTPVVIGTVTGDPPQTTFLDTNPAVGSNVAYTISTQVTDTDTTTGTTQTRQSPPSVPAVLKYDQTIVFGPLANTSLTAGTFNLSATAENSGTNQPSQQLVSFTALGNCTVGSATLNTDGSSTASGLLTAAGSCTVIASQTGSDTFKPATSVAQTFQIAPQSSQGYQAITFGTLPNKTYGDADFSVSATASSGLAVTFAGGGSGCTVSGNNVHITAAGTCSVTASQAGGTVGTTTYNAANPVTQSLTVNAATATITVTPYNVAYDGNPHTATFTATGIFGEDLSSKMTLATTHTAAGDYPSDTWTFAGTSNYIAAAGGVHDVITKATASVTPNPASKVFGSADPTLTGTLSGFAASDGITAAYSRTAGETVAGGPYTITAALSPASALVNYNVTYNTAPFTITPASTVTTLTSSAPNPSDYDAPVTVAATVVALSPSTATVSEGAVAFYVNNNPSPICASNVVSGVGSCQTSSPLPVGSDTIKATYTDSVGNFNGSNSGTQLTQQVNLRTTSVQSLTFSPLDANNTVSVYTAVTVKVTISDADANGTPIVPTGTVTFASTESSDSFSSTSCTLDSTGSCSVTVTPIVPDGRYITVTYGGDAVHSATNNAQSGATNLIVTAPINSQQVCLSAPFNGTAIPNASYVWFNSVFQPRGRDIQSTSLTHITFYNQTITIGSMPAIAVPNAKITFDPSATSASTSFDTTNNVWQTTLPTSTAGKMWLSGLAYPVPAGGLAGGIKPVTWCGYFASDNPNLNIGWQWAAAVYNNFNLDYNALGVKPVDANNLSLYQNSDKAGTPENYKSSVIPGARGGGGSNYTGGYSGSLDPTK